MISYKVENISASDFYLKELSLEITPSQIVSLTDYSWPLLSNAQSIKDGLTNLDLNFYLDDVLLSVSDAITYLTYSTPGGGGGGGTGEVNTASNVGSGDGVFKQKVSANLEFKSFSAGSNITLTPGVDEIVISASGGEVNTASNVGSGDGIFKQKVGSDIELKSFSAGSNITIVPGADEIVINSTAGIPLVTDEATRDATYPSPVNGFQVYNELQGLTETYNSTLDLWLSAGMNVCVEDTTIQVLLVKKVGFISPTAAVVSGKEYPIIDFISSTSQRNITSGVITRIGASTGNANQKFIAVHHLGKYYVDNSAPVTIGLNVYANTAGAGDVISSAFAQTGTIGQAIENSGSNPSFPSSVLVSLQQRR